MATGKPPFAASSLQDLIQEIQEAPLPNVDGCSVMFNDLLSRLLEKDPVKRISWEHLRKHPFWTKEINLRKLPRQPAFESYLKKSRGINPD
jgi:serine/threonine protein kinase